MKNRRAPILFAAQLVLPLATVLLGGCAHYQPKPLAPTHAENQFNSRSLADAGLKAFIETYAPELAKEWPRTSWGLPTLTMTAFYYHPDMEVARAKLAGAEAAVITAGARPNPTASFSPTYNANSALGVSPWTLGFTLDVPIETGGKRGYRIAQAQHLANSSRLNVANTAWFVRSRVRKSLLDLYSANLNAELLAKQQAAQNQTVELLEERLRAGQSSLVEVQLVRVAAAQTALQLRDAQKQSAQAHVRLAAALGLSVSAIENVALSYAMFDRLDFIGEADALRREALLNRADILGSLSEYDASQSALQLEIAKQYPDIHLGPGYSWDQGDNKYSLGVSLTLPVLNQNQGPIAEAEAHRRQAAAAFLALQAGVIGEVDAAFAGYRDALLKQKTADGLLADQRQRMQSMQELFNAGASDRVELLQTQLELNAGELARANTLVEAQRALGLLEDAVRQSADRAGAFEVPSLLLNRKIK